jgi:hypothetical protein
MSKLGSLTTLAVAILMTVATPLFAQTNPLAGVWRFQGAVTGGSFSSELVIFPNGQFSKADHMSGSTETLITGEISVFDNPPTLRLNIRDHQPKQTCGPLGCSPIPMVAAETYQFQVDGDDLILSDEQGQWGPGRWIYHRKLF